MSKNQSSRYRIAFFFAQNGRFKSSELTAFTLTNSKSSSLLKLSFAAILEAIAKFFEDGRLPSTKTQQYSFVMSPVL